MWVTAERIAETGPTKENVFAKRTHQVIEAEEQAADEVPVQLALFHLSVWVTAEGIAETGPTKKSFFAKRTHQVIEAEERAADGVPFSLAIICSIRPRA